VAKKNRRKPSKLRARLQPQVRSLDGYGFNYVLESGSVEDIKRYQSNADAVCEFNWKYYTELAYQRSLVEAELLSALARASTGPYSFEHWQRAVKWKYSLEPLGTKGSVKYGGGRFNIGEIDPSRYPIFEALYIAEDKDTALQETLGQPVEGSNGLLPREVALTAAQSQSLISVSGQIETIIDLSNEPSLELFVKTLRKVNIPSYLMRDAKKLSLGPLKLIADTSELMLSLLAPNWRELPQVVDVPATSQLFGQMARSIGIGGILYPSKFTGKNCLVLYPCNFENTNSFIELDDESPADVDITRIDQTTWRLIEK
jgi:hypothetical protein